MSALSGLLFTVVLGQVGSAPFERTRIDHLECQVPQALAACLYWDQEALSFQQVPGGGATEDMHAAVSRSIETWNAEFAACGNMTLSEQPRGASRRTEYLSSQRNTNTILFRNRDCRDVVPGGTCRGIQDCANVYDCWEFSAGFIAVTTSTYDCLSGGMRDSDIELNAAHFAFTTVDGPSCVQPTPLSACTCTPTGSSCVLTDVQNTMVHELGHSIGLDHTSFAGSTMALEARPGEISKRTIDQGSRDFVCEVYPQGNPSRSCIVRPVEGTLGATAQGCSALPAPGGLAGLGILLWSLRRRRREAGRRGDLVPGEMCVTDRT